MTDRALPLQINEEEKNKPQKNNNNKKNTRTHGETLMSQSLNKLSGAQSAKRAAKLCKLITCKYAAAECFSETLTMFCYHHS